MNKRKKPFARWCRSSGLGGFWWFETDDRFYILQTDDLPPAWVSLQRYDIVPRTGARIYNDWGEELGSGNLFDRN